MEDDLEMAMYAQYMDLALCIYGLTLLGVYLWSKIKYSNELQSITETWMLFRLKKKNYSAAQHKQCLPENPWTSYKS